MATTQYYGGGVRSTAYDPSDPWYQKLKKLEDKHRTRLNWTPERQLRALLEDLEQIFETDPAPEPEWTDDDVEYWRERQQKIEADTRARKARKRREVRRRLTLTPLFRIKYSVLKWASGESGFQVIREILR